MRTFLACGGINGHAESVNKLEELVRKYRPDAVLFAGGLFGERPANERLSEAAQRHHSDIRLLEQFFATVGAMRTVAAVIPGPNDAPLRAFLMAGMHARSQSPGVHLVHCTMVTSGDIVISGVGGELTHTEDSGDPVVRCSRTTAEYFMQAFSSADQSEKVLLLGTAPKGDLGGEFGNEIAAEFIDSYHPKLCVVAGPNDLRGPQRLARTTILNPGYLCEGHAARIDWSQEVDKQIEML